MIALSMKVYPRTSLDSAETIAQLIANDIGYPVEFDFSGSNYYFDPEKKLKNMAQPGGDSRSADPKLCDGIGR